MAPDRPCRVPGCRALLRGGGYCSKHADRAPKRLADLHRGSAASRGYDRKWRYIRAQFLHLHPFCVECERDGQVVAANEVDHIVALAGGGTHEHANLRALCKPHHSARTMRDQVPRRRS